MKEVSPCSNNSESEVSLASARPPHLAGLGVSDRKGVGENAGSLWGRRGGSSKLEAGVRGLRTLLGRPTCFSNAPPRAHLVLLTRYQLGCPDGTEAHSGTPERRAKRSPKCGQKKTPPATHTHAGPLHASCSSDFIHPSLSSPYPSPSLCPHHLSSSRRFSPSSELPKGLAL